LMITESQSAAMAGKTEAQANNSPVRILNFFILYRCDMSPVPRGQAAVFNSYMGNARKMWQKNFAKGMKIEAVLAAGASWM
jgi:hypothetical protein